MRRATRLVLLCCCLAAWPSQAQWGFRHGFGHGGVRFGGFGHFGGFRGPRFGGPFFHRPFFHRPFFHRPFFASRFTFGPFFNRPFFYPFLGSYYYPLAYPAFFDADYAVAPQPRVTIIYLPPAPAYTQPPAYTPPPAYPPSPPPAPPQQPEPQARRYSTEAHRWEPVRFLIPLRDGCIYAAMAYWVLDNTLHFVDLKGDQHTASLDRVDRDLAAKLNRRLGADFGLPPPK